MLINRCEACCTTSSPHPTKFVETTRGGIDCSVPDFDLFQMCLINVIDKFLYTAWIVVQSFLCMGR
jgi:hypothetical protein